MIETRLLRQFIAVAEELHFHKAAARLHMAQPALSQAINRLEDKLGFSLLLRDRRGVQLTTAGSAFLHTAYRTLQELASGIEHARQVSDGIAGTLTVTTVSIGGYTSLLNALRQFREAFPKVRLILKEMPSSAQAKALLAGDADIALLRKLPTCVPPIESRLLLDEEIVLALPVDHPKARGERLDLRAFADEHFVFTPQALGAGYHRQLIALCEAAGFYPTIVQEAAQLHTLIGLVAGGFGVALVPASMAGSSLHGQVVFRPLQPLGESPNPALGLYLSWNSQNESALMKSFIALLDPF